MRTWIACIAIILMAMGTAHARAVSPMDVQQMVIEEALVSRVPPALALAVARVESNFEPRAVSPTGAKGVMQLMPKTARDVFGVGEDELWNPRLNIQLGIDYLSQLYAQYGNRWDLALSHYNGGTLEGGSGANAIPHDYTRKYVADVLRWQRIYAQEVFAQGRQAQASIDWFQRSERTTARPRVPSRIDPFEYDDWAATERRRIERRRNLDDFGRAG
jgi:soluble lytic murein transglycosylase-like protein